MNTNTDWCIAAAWAAAWDAFDALIYEQFGA